MKLTHRMLIAATMMSLFFTIAGTPAQAQNRKEKKGARR